MLAIKQVSFFAIHNKKKISEIARNSIIFMKLEIQFSIFYLLLNTCCQIIHIEAKDKPLSFVIKY